MDFANINKVYFDLTENTKQAIVLEYITKNTNNGILTVSLRDIESHFMQLITYETIRRYIKFFISRNYLHVLRPGRGAAATTYIVDFDAINDKIQQIEIERRNISGQKHVNEYKEESDVDYNMIHKDILDAFNNSENETSKTKKEPTTVVSQVVEPDDDNPVIEPVDVPLEVCLEIERRDREYFATHKYGFHYVT